MCDVQPSDMAVVLRTAINNANLQLDCMPDDLINAIKVWLIQ